MDRDVEVDVVFIYLNLIFKNTSGLHICQERFFVFFRAVISETDLVILRYLL